MHDEGLADAAAASPFRLPRLHPGIGNGSCQSPHLRRRDGEMLLGLAVLARAPLELVEVEVANGATSPVLPQRIFTEVP